MIGGAAYPRPSRMASIDGVKPPILSIPVIEHMNRPAKAIAPYMPKNFPKSKVGGKTIREVYQTGQENFTNRILEKLVGKTWDVCAK